ncbi:hypothetical protein [Chitinivibrio alkaliphilus]|uniref:Long-chain fatty acid transport protein n=1 Tax=Chitinivibrio alkaliphilus ACht1 TaxID=1313304 RepID=U7DCA6_9BACT|nr:hypothetical protein [Chitinivibrio alkaliphilus]ERP39208.1 hypothetical protein CALK_0378 [Chitinivibrio alkaliphilus ACht1]
MKIAISILIMVLVLWADDPLLYRWGVGARAQALGGAYTAIAADHSAFWYNPAGLAYIPFSELQGSLRGGRREKTTRFDGADFSDHMTPIGLGSISYVRSFPVLQGGLAYSISLSSPETMGDVYDVQGYDRYGGFPDTSVYLDGAGNVQVLERGDSVYFSSLDFLSTGDLYYLTTAVGAQISHGVGVGLSLSLVMGEEEQSFKNVFNMVGHPYNFENSLQENERSFFGYDARVGMMVSPDPRYSVGMTVVLPQVITMEQTHRFYNSVSGSYVRDALFFDTAKLYRPLRIKGGAALFLPSLTLSVQAEASAPLSSVRSGEPGSYWKGLGAFGAEYRLSKAHAVRLGYTYREADMHNYRLSWDDGFERTDVYGNTGELHILSAGMGVDFSSQAGLDFSVRYGFPREYSVEYSSWDNNMYEEESFVQGELGFRYRF